jgi:S1-C subfamily serine protease
VGPASNGHGRLVFKELAEERRDAGLAPGTLALRVDHVGQYGEHAVAKRAGFERNDVVIALKGQSDPLTETGFMTRLLQETTPGTRVPITVVRAGKRLEFELPMQ